MEVWLDQFKYLSIIVTFYKYNFYISSSHQATDSNPDYEGIYTESNMESRAFDNNPVYGGL